MSRVDDILAAVELTSILPPETSLRSVGRDKYRGNCPIAEHDRPGSFSVARHPNGHQVFNCYACGLRGSVIDLVAAMERVTIRDTIRKLSDSNVPTLSPDATLQRSYDAYRRSLPEFGYLVCDVTGCDSRKPLVSELDFAILRAGGSWQWRVSPNGKRAICYKH